MTLKEALKKGIGILKDSGIETPAADAGVLLCHAVGCDRIHLHAYGDDAIDEASFERYFKFISKRSEGMPVQYITGHCEFMSLDFDVGPEVLIPRQDTEILVETVISFCRKTGKHMRILDIGAGSGCIAVSLAYHIGECSVTAVDISEKALKTAYRNAVKNRVSEKITFVAGNLFDKLSSARFDVIVSNPPYVRCAEIETLQREVRDFEPHEALDGGEDGLVFYREIAAKASSSLTPGGLLAFEVGCDQAEAVVQILKDGYTDIKIVRDMAGIDRVITARQLQGPIPYRPVRE